MRFSVNMLLFSDGPNKTVLDQFPKLADMGFDGVELPIFAPETVDVDSIRKLAEKHKLKLTATGAPPPGSRFYGSDKAARKAGDKYINNLLDVCAALNVKVLAGPLFKPVGDTDDSIPLDAQRRQTAESFKPHAKKAEQLNIRFGFEPLNRFETNLLNTAEDSIAFCKMIESPAAQLLMDTFHMHIEEKDTPAALKAAHKAGVLGHVHFSENDRGTVGTGQVAWKKVAKKLKKLGYDDWIVLESFCQDNQAIKRAVSCWRPFFDDPLDFCKRGLKFAKAAFK
jgi:D-psicose/D-tagatose/L-ribulose 3-epimerase